MDSLLDLEYKEYGSPCGAGFRSNQKTTYYTCNTHATIVAMANFVMPAITAAHRFTAG